MAELEPVLQDLLAEAEELDRLVADLPASAWATATPAAGWTVAHQIAHLSWTDRMATLAITDPDGFARALAEAAADPDGYVDAAATRGAAAAPAEVLAQWRRNRAELAGALRSVPDGTRISWFGPPMAAPSMATARLMETWAHGGDVTDALGRVRTPTDRVRHVAHLAVRARDFAYLVHDRTPPAEPFRVELAGPSGAIWTWGPPDAANRVLGSAWDFGLLATQRLHRDDADVQAHGAEADEWLDIIQAFAGPPGSGRPARDPR